MHLPGTGPGRQLADGTGNPALMVASNTQYEKGS